MTSRMMRASVAVVATLAALGLSGCGTSAPDAAPADPPPSSTPSSAVTPSSTPSPTPDPTPDAIAPTCENIVSAETVASFTAAGWVAQPLGDGPWTIGDQTLTGVSCAWAPAGTGGTDNFIWFAWSEIDQTQAAAAVSALTASGEHYSEIGIDGTFVHLRPEYSVHTDADGYATTYLFGDGWVAAGDTRADMRLVGAPRAP